MSVSRISSLGDETVWPEISATVAHAQAWLDDIAGHTLTSTLRARTLDELHQRQVELDAILTTAPAHVRGLIEEMQCMAPLPFDALEDLLADLASAHHELWILQHWPHVVEAPQVVEGLGGVRPNLRVDQSGVYPLELFRCHVLALEGRLRSFDSCHD